MSKIEWLEKNFDPEPLREKITEILGTRVPNLICRIEEKSRMIDSYFIYIESDDIPSKGLFEKIIDEERFSV